MSNGSMPDFDPASTGTTKTFFGHPRGLSTLFFTELWERFSFYGMKAMLFLYITAAAFEGGLGVGEMKGGAIAGMYNSFVYLLALPGGWLADRLIGQRRAVLYGAIIIACGHYSMALPGVAEWWRCSGSKTETEIVAFEAEKTKLAASVEAADNEVIDKRDDLEKLQERIADLPDGADSQALVDEEKALAAELEVLERELSEKDARFAERYQGPETLPFFFIGLLLIIFGTGLLKPNISTMVGELYAGDHGARRDAGFSIFYMGINIGAFLAPLACGQVREMWGWHFGFGLAGIGMTFGVIWYILDGKNLGTAGLEPKTSKEERPAAKRTAVLTVVGVGALIGIAAILDSTGVLLMSWTLAADIVGYAILIIVFLFLAYVAFFTGLDWIETKKVIVIAILFVFTALFWSGFEQASTSLNAFARDFTKRVFYDWEIPTEWLQAVNPLFIIAFAPLFGALWIRLAARNLNPSIPVKFALGLLQLSIGFVVIMVAAQLASGIDGVEGEAGRGVLPSWLCLMYLFFTTGELCLSPVGLSTITKLSPPKFVSQMMGIWFIAAALGNLIAGRVGGMIEDQPHAVIFRIVAIIVGGSGLLLLLFSPLINKKMMGGVR